MDKLLISYTPTELCQSVGVNRSTFYYKPRQPKEDTALEQAVHCIFKQSKHAFGSRKIRDSLCAHEGLSCTRYKVSSIMKKHNLKSLYTRPKRNYCKSRVRHSELPNLLNRHFDCHLPWSVIVGDVTYIRLFGKWLYLCTLLDLCGRSIIGYAVDYQRNANLVRAAFYSVQGDLRNIDIFHYDRGSEADNQAIDRLCAVFDIRRSYSAVNTPADNAVIESWHNIIKTEFIHNKLYNFKDLQDFREQLKSYIDWYNNERIHSSLGYLTPTEWRNYVCY